MPTRCCCSVRLGCPGRIPSTCLRMWRAVCCVHVFSLWSARVRCLGPRPVWWPGVSCHPGVRAPRGIRVLGLRWVWMGDVPTSITGLYSAAGVKKLPAVLFHVYPNFIHLLVDFHHHAFEPWWCGGAANSGHFVHTYHPFFLVFCVVGTVFPLSHCTFPQILVACSPVFFLRVLQF